MQPNRPVIPTFLCFDVESIGLHGEAFAVGWVFVRDGVEESAHYAACHPDKARGADSDRAWITANLPYIEPNYSTPRGVRECFESVWTMAKREGAILVADCAWPVEARFLASIVDEDPEARRWWGPYPLHDVASARLAAGFDPLAVLERLPAEEPKHHPLADARQSARLFLEALQQLRRLGARLSSVADELRVAGAPSDRTDGSGVRWPDSRTLPFFARSRDRPRVLFSSNPDTPVEADAHLPDTPLERAVYLLGRAAERLHQGTTFHSLADDCTRSAAELDALLEPPPPPPEQP